MASGDFNAFDGTDDERSVRFSAEQRSISQQILTFVNNHRDAIANHQPSEWESFKVAEMIDNVDLDRKRLIKRINNWAEAVEDAFDPFICHDILDHLPNFIDRARIEIEQHPFIRQQRPEVLQRCVVFSEAQRISQRLEKLRGIRLVQINEIRELAQDHDVTTQVYNKNRITPTATSWLSYSLCAVGSAAAMITSIGTGGLAAPAWAAAIGGVGTVTGIGSTIGKSIVEKTKNEAEKRIKDQVEKIFKDDEKLQIQLRRECERIKKLDVNELTFLRRNRKTEGILGKDSTIEDLCNHFIPLALTFNEALMKTFLAPIITEGVSALGSVITINTGVVGRIAVRCCQGVGAVVGVGFAIWDVVELNKAVDGSKQTESKMGNALRKIADGLEKELAGAAADSQGSRERT